MRGALKASIRVRRAVPCRSSLSLLDLSCGVARFVAPRMIAAGDRSLGRTRGLLREDPGKTQGMLG
jgi:hypothetical protein